VIQLFVIQLQPNTAKEGGEENGSLPVICSGQYGHIPLWSTKPLMYYKPDAACETKKNMYSDSHSCLCERSLSESLLTYLFCWHQPSGSAAG